VLFQNCALGTPFARVDLLVVMNAGKAKPTVFLQCTMKLTAVKSVSYADGDAAPTEHVTFEYGGLQIRYAAQRPDGQLGTVSVSGWNRERNVVDLGDDPLT
jgi:type VI protein secretion system component Hcp